MIAAPVPVYIIDNSCLSNMGKYYPQDIFPGIWQGLTELVADRRLVAPREVDREIQRDTGGNDVCRWADSNGDCFIQHTGELFQKVQEILELFPLAAEPDRQHHADPFLIGLALIQPNQARLGRSESYIVVTDEKRTDVDVARASNLRNVKNIPDICRYYGVLCLNRYDFMRHAEWQFF